MTEHERLSDWLAGSAAFENGDFQKALSLLLPLAEDGLLVAQAAVAQIYMEGLGVPPDPAAAMKWYVKAARRGDTSAEFMVGDALLSGSDGLDKNIEEGVCLLERSANKAYQPAQFTLSCLYRDGLGRSQDLIKAYKWMRLASLDGPPIPGSTEELGGMRLINWLPRDVIGQDLCQSGLRELAARVTDEQISDAERLAEGWDQEFRARSEETHTE